MLLQVESGGDILVRPNTDAAAKFDYNSGQFALRPIAAAAEAVFAQMNDLYFYAVKEPPAVALEALGDVDAKFDSWIQMVK